MKVLLLHGWPVSERVWVSQVSALRDAGFDPVAPHLYGRGPSIDDWAAHLLRDIDGSAARVSDRDGPPRIPQRAQVAIRSQFCIATLATYVTPVPSFTLALSR